MRSSPSIVPGTDRDLYFVLNDYGGQLGRGWAEMDEEDTDRETVLRHLLEGQYSNPVRIVSLNPAEGWSRDASEEIADELQRRLASRDEVSPALAEFLDAYGRPDVQLSLLL